MLYLFGLVVLSYLIAKTLNVNLENRNEVLQQELARVQAKRTQERIDYQDKIHLMNDAFDQFKKD